MDKYDARLLDENLMNELHSTKLKILEEFIVSF